MPEQPEFHIARDIVGHAQVVEITKTSVSDPLTASELKTQLFSLIDPQSPMNFVLDFKHVKTFTSTAFGAVMAFILEVRKRGGRVAICSMEEFIRFGADVIHMRDYAEFHDDLAGALDGLQGA